jgi:hypothetical protein
MTDYPGYPTAAYQPAPAPPPPRRRRSVVALLGAIASFLAIVAALALTGVALAAPTTPEACCADKASTEGAPSDPTTTGTDTRKGVVDHCLVGSWAIVSQTSKIKFFTDADAFKFTSKGGGSFLIKPDGTLTAKFNTTWTSSYQGHPVKLVEVGTTAARWLLLNGKVTFSNYTNYKINYSYYVDGKKVTSGAGKLPANYSSTDSLSCKGTTVTETYAPTGYRSDWVRTNDYGVYR